MFDDKNRRLQIGDYVIATKWKDGDPRDHFAVGFYAGMLSEDRYMIIDHYGYPFRANGFRRVRKISDKRGTWLIGRFKEIEAGSRSLWWWAKAPMSTRP